MTTRTNSAARPPINARRDLRCAVIGALRAAAGWTTFVGTAGSTAGAAGFVAGDTGGVVGNTGGRVTTIVSAPWPGRVGSSITVGASGSAASTPRTTTIVGGS